MPKRISKITQAQGAVEAYIGETGKNVYTQKDLYQLIEEKRIEWGLPGSTPPTQIVYKWLENGFFTKHVFQLSNDEEFIAFLFQEPSIFELAVALRSKSYISHYPAVYLHELTTQVPKTIYTTQELSLKRHPKSSLTQDGIHQAFSKPQRRSHLTTRYKEYTIVLLSGKHSGRNGVLLSTRYKSSFSLTNLERTLIDITVRPNYAGGAFAVLSAYQNAIGLHELSTNRMMAALKALDLIYPYQQAIGFYLERAGYKGRLLDTLRKQITPYEFYLDYDISQRTYNEDWHIWHPTGM